MSEAKIPVRRQMEPFDALMFRSEDNPRVRSTLMGLQIIDRAPDWDSLVEGYERLSRLVISMRQRVVEPPVPVTMPVWVVDPDFDISYHLRRARLPLPGTQRQLLEFMEPMTMTPLDRARPLWEMTLVEGLEDGTAAWVSKMSHAVADGAGGQEMARLSFDTERDPPPKEMPPPPEPVHLTPTDLMRQAFRRAPAEALATAACGWQTAARLGDRAVRRPGRTMSDAAAYVRSLRRMISGPPVEPSPLLRRRSLRRRLAVMEIGLDGLKDASKSMGGSLNDGLLAVVSGGLRLYHEQLGEPVESVPIAIPINVRAADDTSVVGNRWAAARFGLPVAERDVTERIRRIRQLVLAARNEPALNAMSLLAPVAARMPTWLLSLGLGSSTSGHDLQVSNVAGSQVPLYFAGAKVIKVFPFGPVPGPAAMITVYSYLRTLYVGINLDPAAITDPELFTSCLQRGVDEVLSLGRRRPRARRSG